MTPPRLYTLSFINKANAQMTKKLLILAGLVGVSASALAQHAPAHQHQHHHQQQQQHNHQQQQHPHSQHAHSPYSGLQNREIKALSQQQLEDLKAGKGMSLALPAELNGYPGPLHALELADQLNLTSEQKQRIQRLFNAMSTEAKTLGFEVIEAERKLDALFKNKVAQPQSVKEATLKAAEVHARLRESHLRHHLLTIEVLSKEQTQAYNKLRGY